MNGTKAGAEDTCSDGPIGRKRSLCGPETASKGSPQGASGKNGSPRHMPDPSRTHVTQSCSRLTLHRVLDSGQVPLRGSQEETVQQAVLGRLQVFRRRVGLCKRQLGFIHLAVFLGRQMLCTAHATQIWVSRGSPLLLSTYGFRLKMRMTMGSKCSKGRESYSGSKAGESYFSQNVSQAFQWGLSLNRSREFFSLRSKAS